MKLFILKISVAVAAFLLGAFLTSTYKSGNTFLTLTSVKTAFTGNNSRLRVEKKTPKEKIRIEFQGYRTTKTHILVSYWLINDTKESIYYFAVADEPCAMMKLNDTEYGLYDLPTFACSLRPGAQRLKAGQSILFEIPNFESSSSMKLSLDILIGRKGEKRTIESEKFISDRKLSFFESFVKTNSKLPREFYTRRNPLIVARELLGKLLVVPAEDGTRVSGFIVETEAYIAPDDKASHAFNLRRTARNEAMYKIGGTAYVYFIYGMYFQFNVVTNFAEIPHAILIRAVEPLEGIEIMRERRKMANDKNLTNGPGKLCMAFGTDKSLNHEDLLGDKVWIEEADYKISKNKIASGKRIGIDYAEEYAEKPWRFWVKDNPFVSRK